MKPDYPLLGLLARKPASGYDIGKWLRVDGRFLGRKPSMTTAEALATARPISRRTPLTSTSV